MKDERTRNVISRFLQHADKETSDISTAANSHFLIDIEHLESDYILFIATEKQNGIPEKIFNRPRGQKKQSWPTSTCYTDDQLYIYKLIIPAKELTSGGRFFIEKNNTWIRILNPYHSNLKLPTGWSFSPFHLYATYELVENKKEKLQRAFIRTVSSSKGQLIFEGVLITNYDPLGATLTIRKFRDGAFSWDFPLELVSAHRVWGRIGSSYSSYRNEMVYKFKCVIDLPWQSLISSIYTAIIHIGDRSTGLFPFNQTFSKKNGLFEIAQRTIHTYMDVVANNVRIDIYDFDKKYAINAIEKTKKIKNTNDTPVCLVGEYTNAARDNGLRLFQRANSSSEIEYWYVGEEGCGVSGYRFVKFGSKQHLELSLKAKCVAFTHHPNYVMPILPWMSRADKGPKTLFLQHGVTALKNSMPSYHSSKRKFDAFAVCSEREQRSVADACDYSLDLVHIVGMPRLDNLMIMSKDLKDDRTDVIIFPTWRRGLDKMSGEDFLNTTFYKMWSDAMHRTKIACQQNNKRAVLVSHPIIGHHVEYFREFVDDIIDIEKVQEALCSAHILITDYSSICFDAVYIDVPVAFFTFDEAEYGFQEGAFIDTNTDLPGLHCSTLEDLDQHLQDIEGLATKARQCAQARMPLYFENVDTYNCDRTHELIVTLSKETTKRKRNEKNQITHEA
jgi:CDP-glycerol glycerophosphotransferase (TagB/SpsB family)